MSLLDALIKGYAVWLVGAAAIFALLFLLMKLTNGNLASMVLILCVGVATILIGAIAWNTLRQKIQQN
jgi:hypothetical protein